MKKQEILFLLLSLAFFVGGLYGASAVSQSIADYIGQHGWATYNNWSIVIGSGLAVLFLTLLGIRLWLQLPNRKELGIGLFGALFTAFVLTQFVLLPTEYVHLPQFTILTVLLFLAFPRWPLGALLFSQAACIADEWAQSFVPTRVLDINDIFFNFIGMYFGILLYWSIAGIVEHRAKKRMKVNAHPQREETATA